MSALVISLALIVVAYLPGSLPGSLLVLFTHRGNLQRLRTGSESRFGRICPLRECT